MEGEGVLKYANGDRYKGGFKAGKKHGKAVEIMANGTKFEGSYENDERHGKFVEYDKHGNVVKKGSYNHGRLAE